MHKILIKTNELIEVLKESNLIKDLTYSRDILLNDNRILKLINDYRKEENNDIKIKIKQELYKDNNYKTYINRYNELSLIVLKINNKFSEITNVKGCIK